VSLRLLCDDMLAGFARWLRAAGYDTALAEPGASDAVLVARCAAEGRVLITRDRRLARQAGSQIQIVLLVGDDQDRQALDLAEALGIDWTLAPFTRCLMDNAMLDPASADEIAAMPERSRALPGPFRACPVCGRVYWPGSHVRRMNQRLAAWREAALQACKTKSSQP
jgi:uncharacterized protein with PIN domain